MKWSRMPQASQNGSLAYVEGWLCENPGRQLGLDESAASEIYVESQTQSHHDIAPRHLFPALSAAYT